MRTESNESCRTSQRRVKTRTHQKHGGLSTEDTTRHNAKDAAYHASPVTTKFRDEVVKRQKTWVSSTSPTTAATSPTTCSTGGTGTPSLRYPMAPGRVQRQSPAREHERIHASDPYPKRHPTTNTTIRTPREPNRSAPAHARKDGNRTTTHCSPHRPGVLSVSEVLLHIA